MNNALLAIQVLMDVYALGSEIMLTIKNSIATGQDITAEQMSDIVNQRNQILDDMKGIAG